jgi:hypothetical protein
LFALLIVAAGLATVSVIPGAIAIVVAFLIVGRLAMRETAQCADFAHL